MNQITEYIKQLTLGGTEMANRTVFENLLKEINNILEVDCDIVQDVRSQNNSNDQIDFIISYGGNEIAFVETKRLLENGKKFDITKIIDSQQVQKYKKHSLPIILTNYIDFIFINGDIVSEITSIAKIEKDKIKTDKSFEDSYHIIYSWIVELFNSSPAPIGKVSSLASRLALASQKLRTDIFERLQDQSTSIYGTYTEFTNLIGTTSLEDFASSYAETIAYGLLMIRLQTGKEVTKESLLVYKSLGIIQNLAMAIINCDKQIEKTISYITTIVNLIDQEAIQKELAFSVGNDKDPYIYLYEDFLQIYDFEQKKKRGVYYTPLPVVGYIIRSVDWCLREKLTIRKGLKDSRVKILDFAAGTGTFLLEAIRFVLKDEDDNEQKLLIKDHILKNFYAFEYLMAPYAVAHLKIRNYLTSITDDEVLPKILLTNTLHNTDSMHIPSMLTSLMEEGKKAHHIKNKENIIAIIGNPPYSGHSANTDTHITKWDSDIKDSYMMCDNKPLGEKNPKWLNDDYVKFIRFAQWKISQVDKGVVGLITNHGFLDNPTFQGMRQSLMNSFDEMYLLDLHGNSKRKEKTPDGGKDENIFPIQQGVAILILVKNPSLEKKIYSGDLYGMQKEKFNFLENHDITNTEWQDIQPTSVTKYLFKEVKMNKSYPLLLGLKEIFNQSSVGIVTSRDHFAIAFTREEIENRLADFVNPNLSNTYIANKYSLKDTSDFKIDEVRLHFIGKDPKEFAQYIMPINYRTFDTRYILNHSAIIERNRKNIMKHMLKKNIGLITVKSLSSSSFQHVFISNTIIESCYISNKTKEINYIFPLYTYNELYNNEVTSNIYPEALKQISELYKESIKMEQLSPEQVFYYIYALLHHPSYREDFADLLRIDFPRIPFVEEYSLFLQYSKLGEELTKCHLLENFADHPVKHHSNNNTTVTGANYSDNKIYYNKDSYFDNIPQSLWNLHIGGYQVLKSWLDSRKTRTLSLEEIQKFEDIVCALIKAEEIVQNIADLEL